MSAIAMGRFILGTLAILALLAWGTYRTAQVLQHIPIRQNLLLLPAENVLRLALILLCFWLGDNSGFSYARLGWSSDDLARDMSTGLVLGIGVALVLPSLTRFATARFGERVYSPRVVLRVLPRSAREWLLVPLALIPSVLLEELLFRSLLLGGFGALAPPIVLAVIWSIFFGAMHLAQGALGIIVAAVLGLVLSALFLATFSLAAVFVAHYVINVLQLVWAARDRDWLENYDRRMSLDSANAGSDS